MGGLRREHLGADLRALGVVGRLVELTLELVDIRTGEQDKQTATLSKGYHHSRLSRASAGIDRMAETE